MVTSGKNSNDSNLSTINEIKTENSRNYILSKQWLSEKLLTKLQRWCCLDSINSEQKSLLLVDMASYQQQLHRLKNLYAKHLVEVSVATSLIKLGIYLLLYQYISVLIFHEIVSIKILMLL